MSSKKDRLLRELAKVKGYSFRRLKKMYDTLTEWEKMDFSRLTKEYLATSQKNLGNNTSSETKNDSKGQVG